MAGVGAWEEELSWVRCPWGHLRAWATLGLLFVPIPSLSFWRNPFRPRSGSSVFPSSLSSPSSSLCLGEVPHMWIWLPSCPWRLGEERGQYRIFDLWAWSGRRDQFSLCSFKQSHVSYLLTLQPLPEPGVDKTYLPPTTRRTRTFPRVDQGWARGGGR